MLAICIPTFDRVHTGFALSLARLTASFGSQKHMLLNIRMSDLAVARNMVAAHALRSGASEILWLDSDHEFPPTAYQSLKETGKEIVGATYRMRGPTESLAHLGPLGEGDVVEVKALPGGLCLVQASVYTRIGYPWYETKWQEDGTVSTTDYTFAEKVAAIGVKSYVHKPLSYQITHLDEERRVIAHGTL
jgi:hypothetical protein